MAAMFSMSNVGPCQTSWQGTNYTTVAVNHDSAVVYENNCSKSGAVQLMTKESRMTNDESKNSHRIRPCFDSGFGFSAFLRH